MKCRKKKKEKFFKKQLAMLMIEKAHNIVHFKNHKPQEQGKKLNEKGV